MSYLKYIDVLTNGIHVENDKVTYNLIDGNTDSYCYYAKDANDDNDSKWDIVQFKKPDETSDSYVWTKLDYFETRTSGTFTWWTSDTYYMYGQTKIPRIDFPQEIHFDPNGEQPIVIMKAWENNGQTSQSLFVNVSDKSSDGTDYYSKTPLAYICSHANRTTSVSYNLWIQVYGKALPITSS